MYQRFIAVGRLGRDPEVRETSAGLRVATLSLATSDFVKGEERTEWHRVVVWDEKLVEILEKHAAKGSMIAIEGQVRTRRYEKDGREVAVTEIVLDRFHSRLKLLGPRVEREERAPEAATESATGPAAELVLAGAEGEAPEHPSRKAESRSGPRPEAGAVFDDDLPF